VNQALIHIDRDTHFFVRNASRMEELQEQCEVLPLAADQLLHPLVPRHYVVRQGKLRVSQFLDDGREIVRAVLQAGSRLSARPGPMEDPIHPTAVGDKPAADLYSLTSIVIMALGETELWAFSRDPRR
jgi:hypothetical protein